MKRRPPLLPAITLAIALALSLVVSPAATLAANAAPAASKAALKAKVKVDKKATLTFSAVKNKKQAATAKFGTAYKGRVVSLQYKDGSKWRQAASAKMDAKGKATFTLKPVAKKTTYRAVADTHKVKTTKKGKTSTKTITPVATSPVTVTPAATSPSKAALAASVKADKKATLTLLPADYGKKVATAKFGTGYKGRVVSLQYKDGSKWRQAASATMDAKGNVAFTVGSLKNGKTYRAVADTHAVKTTKNKKTTTKTLAPITTPSVKAGSQWKRVVRDDFSGSTLHKRWDHAQVGAFYGSRLCSAVDPGRTSLKSGTLVSSVRKLDGKKAADKKTIDAATKAAKATQQARKDAAIEAAKKLKGSARTDALKTANAMKVNGCPDGVFHNARVETKGSFYMTEGMLAARVKFPKAQGMHGSVWLQSDLLGTKPAGAEIDMIESFGYGKGVSNILHVDEKSTGQLTQFGGYVLGDRTKDPKWWDQYHVYSVEWTRSEFVFRIDGVETSRIKKTAVKGDRYFLAISMLASDWETPLMTKPSGKLPGIQKANLSTATMHVDWIEGWKRS
jgi:beta-glucanase (GH16 family)/nuclear transport factor 2 (NTF2) superfamily protein